MSPPLHTARYRDIADAIADRLIADPALEVIVSSGGVRTAILTELLRRTPSGVTAARIYGLEQFARMLVNDAGEYPRVASDAERRLAMRTAVRSIDDPILESHGIAAMLERSYRDVRDSGLTLAVFESRARRRGRSPLLARVWREYERLIAALGAIDPADLLARAKPRGGRFLVAGFYDMTVVQRRFIEQLDCEIFVPVTSSDAYTFARPFIEVLGGASLIENESRSSEWSVASFNTKNDELREVAAQIATLLAQGETSIGIVARSLDPYDVDTIARAAAERGFATTANTEIPLLAQRIGRGVASLLRIRERGFPRREVFELLRDGLRVKRTIDIDRADFATRGARIAGGTSDELRPLARKPMVDDYVAVVAEIESITSDLTKWPSFASLFAIETRQDAAAVEAIDEIASLFKRAQTWRKPFDVNAILDAFEQTTLQQRDRSDQLPVVFAGDVMRMRGRTFDHLFAVKMQDDLFPQRRTDDPLLPDSDRRAIGVREIGDGKDEERLLFQLLLDSTNAIHFSLAGGDGFGKTLRPSPLLKSFAMERLPDARTEILKRFIPYFAKPASPRIVSHATTRQLQLLVKSGTRSPFDGYLVPRERFAEVLKGITPTQLEDFGECPQKFLIKHVLGAVDIDDPERELQMHQREKGTLLHTILERFYRNLTDDDMRRATWLRERLHAIIDNEFDRLERESPPFNRTWRDIERRATKRTLAEFVTADLAEMQASEMTPKHFEYSFGTKYAKRGTADHPEPFTIVTNGVTLQVDGRIDRIDANERGGLRIVDYKSGKALRHKKLDEKIDRGTRLQLAVYAMAVAEFFGTSALNVRGAIKPLVLGGAKAEKYAFSLAEKESRLRETIDLFVASILDGVFPAFPGGDDDDDVNGCKYCPVEHSCRTLHDSEERYGVRKSKDPRTLLENAP